MVKIVIVDDEESTRSLCTEELIREGYEVISTGQCEKVPELIASTRPSAIVLDIRIDECDGLELLEDIREEHPSLPIILHSAYDSYKDNEKSMAADYYVVKSYNRDELKRIVADAVRRNVSQHQ